MADWLLTSLELEDILKTPRSMIQCEDAVKAQARHIVKLLNEPCKEHCRYIEQGQFRVYTYRKDCPVCMKELEETVR